MKKITLEISDVLYTELMSLRERESDTIEKVATDILFDMAFEEEFSEAWEHFNDYDEAFVQHEQLSDMMQKFSDVVIICADTGDMTKEDGFSYLLEANALLANYADSKTPEDEQNVIAYMNNVYEEYKEALATEVKRLSELIFEFENTENSQFIGDLEHDCHCGRHHESHEHHHCNHEHENAHHGCGCGHKHKGH